MKNSLYDLYLISREFPNGTFTTKELLKLFGYSKNSKIQDSKIYYFAERYIYSHPTWIWKVKDIVAIKPSLINIDYDALTIKGPDKKNLRLINRKEAPFYLLKEYGGPII